jgi:predicted nucleic acid-binding Zn ribbon protein
MSEDHKSIGDVLKNMLKTYRLDRKLSEVDLASAWKDIAGEMIARHTKSVEIKSNTLYVYVKSTPLRTELRYHKQVIMEKVNAHLGENRIQEIVIR